MMIFVMTSSEPMLLSQLVQDVPSCASKDLLIIRFQFQVEPETVESLIINPGERYDFIITANQSISNYWIRVDSMEVMMFPSSYMDVFPCDVINVLVSLIYL